MAMSDLDASFNHHSDGGDYMSLLIRCILVTMLMTGGWTGLVRGEEGAPTETTAPTGTDSNPDSQGVESRGLPKPPPIFNPAAKELRPIPLGTVNRLPLRATSVFDTQFNVNADGPNPVKSYLATYLTTLVYPEFIDQLSGSSLVQNETYTKSLHTNPATFFSEFTRYTAHLFHNPVYAWIYSDQGGYNPEAMLISTSKAVFAVFRGTDRVGAEKTKAGYNYAEWVSSNFYAIHDDSDVPALAGKVHKGFWDSLKTRLLLRGQQFSAHNVTTTLMLCGFHSHYCCLSC